MRTARRIALAAIAATATAVPVSLVVGGWMWAYLEGTLHYGCFQGRGGEEGYGWICGDGMTKVLPSIFIAGAIVVAFFCCYLVLFSLTSGSEPIVGWYPIAAIVATIPSSLWIAAESQATLAYLEPPLRARADFIGSIYGISLVFLAAATALLLVTCLFRSRIIRRVLHVVVGIFAILSVVVAPVSIAVVAPWMVSLVAITLTTFYPRSVRPFPSPRRPTTLMG